MMATMIDALQYADLMEAHSQCRNVHDEKSALEKIVLKLRGQLRDFEKTDLEKAELCSKLSAVEDNLRHKVKRLRYNNTE